MYGFSLVSGVQMLKVSGVHIATVGVGCKAVAVAVTR